MGVCCRNVSFPLSWQFAYAEHTEYDNFRRKKKTPVEALANPYQGKEVILIRPPQGKSPEPGF